MEARLGLGSSEYTHGLQELYTDFDQWICKFNARLTSLSDDSTCKAASKQPVSSTACSTACKAASKQHSAETTQKTEDCTEIQPSSEVSAPLQEIFVNGLLVRQIRKVPLKNDLVDFFNIFKTNDGFTNFDSVLLTLFNVNGRRNLYKCIQSKI